MRFRLSLLMLSILLAASSALAAPEPEKPKAAKPAASLDKDLLKQLGDDPLADDLKPADAKPAGAKSTEKPGTAKPAGDPSLDKQLLDGLMEGEDIGAPDDPLARIGKQMRQAGGLIGQTKSDGQTQELQKRIVTDLDKLIREARKQQQQQSSSSSKQQMSRRDQVKQSQPGTTQRKPNDEPAKDSSQQLGKNDVRKPDMAQMSNLIKDIWGQLPERQREQMMQNSIDQFLPKYELLIEEYFKALVERQQADSSR